MTLPFDGAISEFYRSGAPDAVRLAVAEGSKRDILADDFPYERWMDKADYEEEMRGLQVEMVKLQHWLRGSGARIVVLFEGRDAAGKGGAISRLTANLNPRVARVEALAKPSDQEATQWYFQRYIARLPSGGQMVLFDRSWYNRAVVEHVFGFCTTEERERFFHQLPAVEQTLVSDGIHLIKIWLNVSRPEQLRRMLAREKDVLKQWKLSEIDVEGLKKWDAYSDAIRETLERSHSVTAPWTVIRADDKYRARLAVTRRVLSAVDYPGRDAETIGAPDPAICGGPDIWHG